MRETSLSTKVIPRARSWNDQGVDGLDAGDSINGETDTYNWTEFQSQTQAVSGEADTSSSPTDENYGFDSAAYETSYVSATGCDTLSVDDLDSDSLTLVAGAVSYTQSGLTDVDAALETSWGYDSLSIGPSQFKSGSAVVDSDSSAISAFETVGYLSESGTETIDSVSDSTDILNSGDVDYHYLWNDDFYGLSGTMSGSGDNSYGFNSSSDTIIDSDSSLGADEAVSYTHGGLSIVSAVADGTGTYVYGSGASFPWQATDNFNLSIDYAQVGTSTHLDDGSYSFSYESGTETNRDDSYTASEYDGWYPDFPFTWNDNSGVSQAGFLNSFSHGDSSSGATTVSGDEPSTFATYADETWGLPAVNPGVSAGAVSPTPPLMPSPAHPDLTLPLAMAPVAIAMHPDTSMMQGITNDDVSRTSPVSPTIVLTALAAAGRNPTDITIPTQAGTDGSGDDEEDAVAAGGGATFAAMDDEGGGAHEFLQQQYIGPMMTMDWGPALLRAWDGFRAKFASNGDKVGTATGHFGEQASKNAALEYQLAIGDENDATTSLGRGDIDKDEFERRVAEARRLRGRSLREDGKIGAEGLVAGAELAVDTANVISIGASVRGAAAVALKGH